MTIHIRKRSSRPLSIVRTTQSALAATAVDIDPQGWDIYAGSGLIDAGLALAYWPPSFIDVPVSHWAWRSIEALNASEITSGCSANPPMYCPDGLVSRAETAVFLLRGLYGPDYAPPPATGVFDDVEQASFTAPWIEAFYTQGITTGCATDPLRYCPEAILTRAQMAVFLVRTKYGSDFLPPSPQGTFSDVPLDGFFDRYIEQLYADGITIGCGTHPLRYCPQHQVSRAEMAVFLDRLFGLNPLP